MYWISVASEPRAAVSNLGKAISESGMAIAQLKLLLNCDFELEYCACRTMFFSKLGATISEINTVNFEFPLVITEMSCGIRS